MTSVTLQDMEEAVACKNLCKLDATGRFCIACGRTIEQIIQAGKKTS